MPKAMTMTDRKGGGYVWDAGVLGPDRTEGARLVSMSGGGLFSFMKGRDLTTFGG